ncbi:hypothetical protein QYZ88_007130 [Lachnospiraceae bacterium C1.1]|nr:hypothetical protein [Lachnospiraceae bacterium C1.1]
MKRIDRFPTRKIADIEYGRGSVLPFGASLAEDAINFSVYSKEASSCSLLQNSKRESPWF